MSNYVDWAYYSSHFPNVSESEFSLLNLQAQKKIDILTNRRSQTVVDTYKVDQLKDCVCNLINAIDQQNKSGLGDGVASVSNDGYSETYSVITKDQKEIELKSVARQWLSGTGLMGAVML